MAEISALEVALSLTGIDLVLEGLGALVGVFDGAVTSAIDFQTELTQIQNNTTMTAGDMGALSAGVLQLAQDSGAATDTLGTGFMKAMNIVGNTAAAMAILTVATESAVSTGGNAASTTNVLANAMHEYGLDIVKAKDGTLDLTAVQANAAHVMGVMHLAAAEGNMTLEQFSESSGKSIGIAANLGVSLEDVSAAFAALTKHGFDAAQSGTQVTDMLTHMINPTKAQIKELERVSALTGVNLVADFSASGLHAKGLTGVLADLTTAYRRMGLTEAQAEQESMKLINAQRGGLGLASLLGTGAADYASILADLDDQTKVNAITEESYNRTRETVGNQWARLQQIAHATAITVGSALLPALSGLLGHLIPLAQSVGPRVLGVMADFREVLGGGFGAGTVGGTLATGFLLLKDSVTNRVIPALQLLWRSFFPPGKVDWMGVLQKGVLGVARGVETLARWFQLGVDGIVTFKQALAGQWWGGQDTGVLTPIRLLGRGIQLIRDAVITVRQVFAGQWVPSDSIQPAILTIGRFAQFLTSIPDIIEENLTRFGDWRDRAVGAFNAASAVVTGRLLPALARAHAWFDANLLPVLARVAGVIRSSLGPALAWLADHWRLVSTVGGVVVGLLAGLPGWFILGAAAIKLLVYGWQIGWDTIKQNALSFITQTLPGWLAALGTWLTGTALPWIGARLRELGLRFGTWVLDGIQSLQANLPLWLAALDTWLTGTALPWVRQALVGFAHEFGYWLGNTAIPFLLLQLPLWLAALNQWIITTAIPEVVKTIHGLGEKFAEWIVTDAIPWLVTNLPKFLVAFNDWVFTTMIPAVAKFGLDVGTAFATGIIEGLAKRFPALTGVLEQLHIITPAPTTSTGGAVKSGAGASGGALGGGTGGGLGGDGGFTPLSKTTGPVTINITMTGPTTDELAQSMADHLYGAVSAYLAPGNGGAVAA